jgi:hypothetical protein
VGEWTWGITNFNYYDDISMVKRFYNQGISVPMTPFLIDVCGKEYRTGLTSKIR